MVFFRGLFTIMVKQFPDSRWTRSVIMIPAASMHILIIPTHERGGPYYQLLFKMPGYNHSIYRETKPGGYFIWKTANLHLIRIELKDAYGNISKLEFKVRYEPAENGQAIYAGKIFYPGMLDGFEAPNAAFYLGQTCLYDSLHLNYAELTTVGKDLVSAMHNFGNTQVPLADTMTVRIKLSGSAESKRIMF